MSCLATGFRRNIVFLLGIEDCGRAILNFVGRPQIYLPGPEHGHRASAQHPLGERRQPAKCDQRQTRTDQQRQKCSAKPVDRVQQDAEAIQQRHGTRSA